MLKKSSLLDEVIVEANELKMAARQQAEKDVTEKYAEEIRRKMESLLAESVVKEDVLNELEDDLEFSDPSMGDDLGGMEGMDDLGGGDELDLSGGLDFEDDLEVYDDGGGTDEFLEEQAPFGFEDDIEGFGDDEQIEIDFNELMSLADEEDVEEDEFLDGDELGDELGLGMDDDLGPTEEAPLIDDDESANLLEELEDLDLDFEEDEEGDEDFFVDTDAVPTGYSPRDKVSKSKLVRDEIGQYNSTDNKKQHLKSKGVSHSKKLGMGEKEEKDSSKDGMYLDEIKSIRNKLLEYKKEQDEQKNVLLKENKVIKKANRQLYDNLQETLDLLKESGLLNRKLSLQVKILKNVSLNEQQKTRIVEAISKAKTAEEAENMFNLLQDSTAPPRRSGMNPLSEVLDKMPKASLVAKGRREEAESNVDPETEAQIRRWQIMAGIRKE